MTAPPPGTTLGTVLWLLPALLLHTAQAGDCGLTDAIIPDFSLQDANPASVSLGETFSRDEMLGKVLVIYWAVAT